VKRGSRPTSHSTSTFTIGMPPPSSGRGARRVHSTTPSGSGSPDDTPSEKGVRVEDRRRRQPSRQERRRDRAGAEDPRNLHQLAP
jgi:hypothetical protein